jgi:hypothetical protein
LIKPKKPALLADDSTLKEYEKAQSKYIEKMFDTILRESKVKTLPEVLIYLCETYHPDFIIKEKRGAKTKWSDYLKAILAVDLDVRKKKHKQIKAAIIELCDDKYWSKMFIDNKSPLELIRLIAKGGKSNMHYKLVKLLYEDSQSKEPGIVKNWDLFIKEEVNEALKEK